MKLSLTVFLMSMVFIAFKTFAFTLQCPSGSYSQIKAAWYKHGAEYAVEFYCDSYRQIKEIKGECLIGDQKVQRVEPGPHMAGTICTSKDPKRCKLVCRD